MSNKNQVRQGAGRPQKNKQPTRVIHAQRQTSEPVYQMWTQHKRVLIALELQFMHDRKKNNESNQKSQEAKIKKKYQSGFLYVQKINQKNNIELEEAQQFKKDQVKNYKKCWQLLSKDPQNQRKRDLRDILMTALEIKHQNYRKEFIPIYEIILNYIEQDEAYLIKQINRRAWQNKLIQDVRQHLQTRQSPLLTNIIKQGGKIDFYNFIKKHGYCFLAQYYNFRINEYYCEAFSYEEQDGEKDKKKKKE